MFYNTNETQLLMVRYRQTNQARNLMIHILLIIKNAYQIEILLLQVFYMDEVVLLR